MRVVEVLSMEKAKRFLCHVCDGLSITIAKISIYFETTLILRHIFCKKVFFYKWILIDSLVISKTSITFARIFLDNG